jgi:type II secretory pathway pseudopilin PulG
MDRPLAPGSSKERGFSYLGLLILVGILSVTSAALQSASAIAQRIEAEQELLRVGREMQLALVQYHEVTPNGQRVHPATLADLQEDPRQPKVRRHLRRIPIDPLTGTREWGLIRTADGQGIVAVFSRASGTPVKLTGFPLEFRHFAGKPSYRDWRFGWSGEQTSALSPSVR